jgi:hypothetical protein
MEWRETVLLNLIVACVTGSMVYYPILAQQAGRQ